LKLLFASDVPLRGLHRSVIEEKLNLFQFASTTIAQARASAAKIVGCQIAYADPLDSPKPEPEAPTPINRKSRQQTPST
jgi:hypothetical protein